MCKICNIINPWLVAFVLVLIVSHLYGCGQTEDDTRKYITESERQWAETVASNDTTVLHRILADDFVWVLDGKVLSKRAAIDDARSGPGDFVSDHLDSVSIRFYGNTAVTRGSETWTRRVNKDSTYSGKFVWTDTWIKRNGQWQIVSAEDITVPDRH
jgi:ketosteroid isomerase-like protein